MLKSYLFVLNDGPYSTERSYKALCWAAILLKSPRVSLKVFLLGDATQCAVKGQDTPQGFYNVERMIRILLSKGTVAA